MKLTGLFKKRKAVETMEEKTIIDGADIEITEDELGRVDGGAGEGKDNARKVERDCPKCGGVKAFRVVSGGRAYCMECGTQIII